MKIRDLLKRKQEEKKPEKSEKEEKIEIVIEGDTGKFPNEREQIIAGAKELMKTGMFKDTEEAILYVAAVFRGLKIEKREKDENGTKIILRDTSGKVTDKDDR